MNTKLKESNVRFMIRVLVEKTRNRFLGIITEDVYCTRVLRGCPDPYFFPEPGPDPVGIGIGIGIDDSTGPGLKSRTLLQRGRDRDGMKLFGT